MSSMSSVTNFHYLLKYIIVGDSFAGKSNILLQFSQKKFKIDHEITIGVEFGAKNISVGDEKVYRIQIWDTAGQETFKSITRAYYKNSACAFLVYDVTKKTSFYNINSWLEECKSQSPKTIQFVLVGNKVDLDEKREVTTEEGMELAKKNNMLFYECSAKTRYNIDEVFYESAKAIAKNIQNNYYDLSLETCGIKKGIGAETVARPSHVLIPEVKKKTLKKKKGCC